MPRTGECRFFTTVHIESEQMTLFPNVVSAAIEHRFNNSPMHNGDELIMTSVTVGPMTAHARKIFDKQMKVLGLRIVNTERD